MNPKEKIDSKQIGIYYKETLKNGKVSFSKQITLGKDDLTGKKVITTIRAKSFNELKLKIERKKEEFRSNGSQMTKKQGITTFRELAENWWDIFKITVKIGTRQNNRLWLDLYLLPAFGDIKLEKLTPTMIQNEVSTWAKKAQNFKSNEYAKKGSTKSYPKIVRLLRRILNHGVKLELLEKNPAQLVEIPRYVSTEPKKIKFYDKEELQQFFDALAKMEPSNNGFLDDYKIKLLQTYFRLLAYSGMRPSEAIALDWKDIDFDAQTVSISKTLGRDGKVSLTPKTVNSNRTIKLDPATMKALQTWKAYQDAKNKDFGTPDRMLHVFARFEDASYYRLQNFWMLMKNFYEKHGLKNIGFHGFRHTHASILLNAGVGYKEIKERLGHRDISLTMNTYSHLFKESEDNLIDQMERFLSN